MRLKIAAFAFFVTLAIGGSSFGIERTVAPQDDNIGYLAQAEPDATQPPKDMPMHPETFGKRGEFGPGPKRFERLRLRKMIELLELEGETRDRFVEVAQKYHGMQFELFRAHKAMVDSLATGIRSGKLDEEGINYFVLQLEESERRQMEMRREFRQEIRPLLEPEQFGKLVVFEHRFEAQIFNHLNKFRRGGGPSRGTPGGFQRDGKPKMGNDSI